jgi:hypothetical protein
VSRSFKIVGRVIEERSPWGGWLGKVGTQWKKRVYTSFDDFKRYGSETAMRWEKFCGVKVEAYEMVDDKWVSCELPEG